MSREYATVVRALLVAYIILGGVAAKFGWDTRNAIAIATLALSVAVLLLAIIIEAKLDRLAQTGTTRNVQGTNLS